MHRDLDDDFSFWIEGATKAELQHGIRAAKDFFEIAAVSPKKAAQGRFARDAWAAAGHPESAPSAAQLHAADIWDEADKVAVQAACSAWLHQPNTRVLRLIWKGWLH